MEIPVSWDRGIFSDILRIEPFGLILTKYTFEQHYNYVNMELDICGAKSNENNLALHV